MTATPTPNKADSSDRPTTGVELGALIDQALAESHDYQTSAEAVADAVVATFDLMAGKLGLTGFQASWAALNAYAQVMHYECPLIVLKGEDMLYPQYDLPARLREWMNESKPWLAEHAQKLLDEKGDDGMVVDRVRQHWRKLARARLSVAPDIANCEPS